MKDESKRTRVIETITEGVDTESLITALTTLDESQLREIAATIAFREASMEGIRFEDTAGFIILSAMHD